MWERAVFYLLGPIANYQPTLLPRTSRGSCERFVVLYFHKFNNIYILSLRYKLSKMQEMG